MAGIAGIAAPARAQLVGRMLERIAHRGPAGQQVIGSAAVTLGAVWPAAQTQEKVVNYRPCAVHDGAGFGPFAAARESQEGLALIRGPYGVAPLYYGRTVDGVLCFASEVKALLEATRDVHELPPGHWLSDGQVRDYRRPEDDTPLEGPPKRIARELRRHLLTAVGSRVVSKQTGAWLSGGLDSSAVAALASSLGRPLHTFAAGMEGAPDLMHARSVAHYIGSQHHELVFDFDQMLAVLPDVIFHLESFDALLVRSSIAHYLVARLAADYVPSVLSGEGGDELFAGYAYLKSLPQDQLAAELLDITARLHNTALQRVDRCASAHGLEAHVPFLDPLVAEYALRIPVRYKLHRGVEKWILRKAMARELPEEVLTRPKAKFWKGAGIEGRMAAYAQERISDGEFVRERTLPDGQVLRSKEELMYYRIFREHFGMLDDMTWMGRTKGVS